MDQKDSNTGLKERLDERNWKLAQHRKQYTKRYYQELSEAKEKGIPVAHTTALIPAELLYSMGVMVCMPENYVTICAAKQMAQGFVEEAEKHGYSMHLCSYSRCGMGMMYNEDGPYGKMPDPDVCIGSPIGCDPHTKWFEVAANYYDVPFFNMDGPYNYLGKVEEYEIEWMIDELKRLISFLEEYTSARFDYDRFKEAMLLSGKALELFTEVLNLRKNIPTPRGIREAIGDSFYLVTQLGREGAVEYYSMLLEDIKDRVQRNMSAVPEEKYRVFYHNIPLWYNLQTFDYLADHGAVVPIEFYNSFIWNAYYSDGNRFDPEDPFRSCALKHLFADNNMGLPAKVKRVLRCIEEWHCDGAIFFSNRSCKVHSICQLDESDKMEAVHGIPTMFFEAEMADPRSFAEGPWKNRVDAFLELLEEKKHSK
jgi:benzoyl-CoA reductase/2-hydroxyglutaryl-CoA dehydratase subunit BcrC/BadD/HgdB